MVFVAASQQSAADCFPKKNGGALPTPLRRGSGRCQTSILFGRRPAVLKNNKCFLTPVVIFRKVTQQAMRKYVKFRSLTEGAIAPAIFISQSGVTRRPGARKPFSGTTKSKSFWRVPSAVTCPCRFRRATDQGPRNKNYQL